MKERSILFNGDMVRAILDGRKTQTRRPMKEQPHEGSKFHGMVQCFGEPRALFWCEGQPSNYGTPLPMHVGDRFWVAETWAAVDWCNDSKPSDFGSAVWYKADDSGPHAAAAIPYKTDKRGKWRPPIGIPRWASRIDLEITRVWVERVQDITDEDAKKEGVKVGEDRSYSFAEHGLKYEPHKDAFRDLWQSIYGTWDANPFVWAYEFRRVKP